MEQNKRQNVKTSLELTGLLLATYIINILIFSSDPGFLLSPVNPYLAISLLAAAYYGKLFGFLSLALSFVILIIPYGGAESITDHMAALWQRLGIKFSATLVGVYIFGMIRDMYITQINNYKVLSKKQVFEKYKYKNEVESLSAVNRELEERVLRQNESVTSLYAQIKALHKQNLTETLRVLLATVNKFTWAEKASIWRFDRENNSLVMMANIGWIDQDFELSIIDAEESIEGWCFRNNMTFSVRMLLENDNLMKMDKKRNILTYPINFSNSPWGVLNIEDMPFTKYNLYVEKIMSILVDLASPEIERAFEYESTIVYEEINSVTNLPAFTQFRSIVERNISKSLEHNSTFSIVLIEMINFDDLAETFNEEMTYKLALHMIEKLKELSGNKIDYFHYKERNQFAIYYRDIDFDGISFFCLESLGIINSSSWNINEQPVVIDAVLGYSSMGHQQISVDEMLSVAENLLEMQKI